MPIDEKAKWVHLVEPDHPWKRQLYVKGRKLPAAAVWTAMRANHMAVLEAADNWSLPIEAVHEILEYCESEKAHLEMEAAEELSILLRMGVSSRHQTTEK